MAYGLFIFLIFVYSLNGDFLPGNDAKANLYLPITLLNERNLSYAPQEFPFMFQWKENTPSPHRAGSRPLSDPIPSGSVEIPKPHYYLTPSVREGLYVNTFGIGAGMTALPVFAILKLSGHDPANNPEYLWYGGKVVATVSVAASAVFVFLSTLYFCRKEAAILIAVAYGLGTCVWSISSQTLWQHGPNEFFLSLGAWLLIRSRHHNPLSALWCGTALGCAVLCRPTSAVVVLAVGIYFLAVDRQALLKFVIGGLPLAVALLIYNDHYLGAPFAFGQTARGLDVAVSKTGTAALWQTPLWQGAAGLLFSPSRGLFVYSPFLLLILPSFYLVWKIPKFRVLIPLAAGAIVMMIIAFKWFDWWGGWCYGYRPLVDTMPLLALLLIPVVEWLLNQPSRRGVVIALLGWSIMVQWIGAFSYDVVGWNARTSPNQYDALLANKTVMRFHAINEGSAVEAANKLGAVRLSHVRQDIDQPSFRNRLWSVTDNPIFYYLSNYNTSRKSKKAMIDRELSSR